MDGYDYLAGYFTFSGKNYDNFRYQQLFLLKTDIEGNQEWIKTIDGLIEPSKILSSMLTASSALSCISICG